MEAEMEVSKSLIARVYAEFANGIHFATPISSLRTNEVELVKGVLRMFQGFSSSHFVWDQNRKCFFAENGIYVTHLSQTSLYTILNQFVYAATCLQLVENVVHKVEKSFKKSPTLKAFVCSASSWLKSLRDVALMEEMNTSNAGGLTTPTLLGLARSLSSLCSGAEYLWQIVDGAIPQMYFGLSSVPAADLVVHVLDYLYKRLDEVCLVQGGEEEAYQMVLHMYMGSLLPYIEGLDSWLFEGTLDDPYDEMFFYANKAISVDESEFWEKSYLFRVLQHYDLDVALSTTGFAGDSLPVPDEKKEMSGRGSLAGGIKGKEQSVRGCQACPMFIKDLAKSIVSAGKSLQLMQHIPATSAAACCKDSDHATESNKGTQNGIYSAQGIAGLTLSEVFCVSLAGLLGHDDRVHNYIWLDKWSKSEVVSPVKDSEIFLSPKHGEKIRYEFLVDTVLQKEVDDLKLDNRDTADSSNSKEQNLTPSFTDELSLSELCRENPIITVCLQVLRKQKDTWNMLNPSQNFCLPPLDDDALREAIFGGGSGAPSAHGGTNYMYGFQYGESEYLRSQDDIKLLEMLFPFPTILPAFQDNVLVSELLPFQKDSTIPSRVLCWIQNVEPRNTPLPLTILQECLTIYIKKQVDYIGRHILLKLMNDWRLMDELALLRAIYLLGSGDLLQHFLTIIFSKLDKGESWDDDFELNTILQESISNSADSTLFGAPDLLVVSLTKSPGHDGEEHSSMAAVSSTPHKSRVNSFGLDGLDSLNFTYKVPWPLELIANSEALKKYNQVMRFLLKVKRAKFVLDKVRRWMWKGRGSVANNLKQHWLVEQKLLHFVDAFHQYVMDRVYHSAWRELCEGMAVAKCLDEVIEVHDAYLLSIQRQCFVVPDKLWALIASRINGILGLALNFYSLQQTLSSGGAVSAVKARCEMEVDRIEKQFDDYIVFLLRVLSFKLNVGHFPHLADLVTRINYNYYYMSPSGNLRTAPSSESVASRLG